MRPPHRIVVVTAGYNVSRNGFFSKAKAGLERLLVKLSYGEDLVDNRNKAAYVIDENTGKQLIEYPVDALNQIESTHVIVVGDNRPELGENRLENILAKEQRKCVHKVIQMGSSLIDNYQLGREEMRSLYRELVSKGQEVSPHLFILSGDSFYATDASLLDAFIKIEKKDADLSYGWCPYASRDLFDYRPWFKAWADVKDDIPGQQPPAEMPEKFRGIYKQHWGRNSNIGAERQTIESDQRPRGVPTAKEELVQTAYDIRKLLSAKGKGKLLSLFFAEFIRYAASSLFGNVRNVVLSEVAEKISSLFQADVRYFYAHPSLEPDIDSKGDLARARKMIWVGKHPHTAVEDCEAKYEELLATKCRKIQLVGLKIKNAGIGFVEEELRNIQLKHLFRYDGFYFNSLNPDANHAALLYYDLMKAHDREWQKNRQYALELVNKTSQAVRPNLDKRDLGLLVHQNTLYKFLDAMLRTQDLDKKQFKAVLNCNIALNALEKRKTYDPAEADRIVSKYCKGKA